MIQVAMAYRVTILLLTMTAIGVTGCSNPRKITFEEKFARDYELVIDNNQDYREILEGICEWTRLMAQEVNGFPILEPGWKISKRSDGTTPVVLTREGVWTGTANIAFIVRKENVIVVNTGKLTRGLDEDVAVAREFFVPETFQHFPKGKELVKARLLNAILHELGHLTPPEVMLEMIERDRQRDR